MSWGCCNRTTNSGLHLFSDHSGGQKSKIQKGCAPFSLEALAAAGLPWRGTSFSAPSSPGLSRWSSLEILNYICRDPFPKYVPVHRFQG